MNYKKRIEEILLENIIWGEKKKEVYVSKIFPEMKKLLHDFSEELIGEDEDYLKLTAETQDYWKEQNEKIREKNKLRAEQRKREMKLLGGKR